MFRGPGPNLIEVPHVADHAADQRAQKPARGPPDRDCPTIGGRLRGGAAAIKSSAIEAAATPPGIAAVGSGSAGRLSGLAPGLSGLPDQVLRA